VSAFFNELDPYAAQWLRNLMFAGHIAKGIVDARSIKDVTPNDIGGGQSHFFAGTGVWSHAARVAGWPDDFPLWSGSCPCQPFSAAGAGLGVEDERHLWPEWFRLIRECRPPVVVGEQVASGDGLGWLDVVHADLEGEGYAFTAFDLCAAGVGAPHIRQRIYFAAVRLDGRDEAKSRLVYSDSSNTRRHARATAGAQGEDASQGHERRRVSVEPLDSGADGFWLGNTDDERPQGFAGPSDGVGQPRRDDALKTGPTPTSGFWSDVAWLDCRDGKRRPTQPGLFPLADGVAARVGRLRAYGNAIVGPLATTFLRCLRDSLTNP